ncbi:MAG: transcription antitermination factor NusB [Gemmatimonadales bacterium]
MGSRTKARARALQVLYAWELRGGDEPLRVVERELVMEEAPSPDPEVRRYATRLLDAIEEDGFKVDARLEVHATNWRLSRMAAVDRNILRIAAVEMLHIDDVPLRVSVQEAIRLAEWFGTEESRRFVNGVLDALLHELEPKRRSDAR